MRTVEADLEGLRAQVLDARQTGRADTELALTGVWQGRLQQLLLDEPTVAAELRRAVPWNRHVLSTEWVDASY